MDVLALTVAVLQQAPGPTPQESQRAAIAIVLIMLGGLLLTIGLLRWVAKSERAKAGARAEQEPWTAIEQRLAEEDYKSVGEITDEQNSRG